MTKASAVIEERRSELQTATESAERAAALEAEIAGLQDDLKRHERIRDRLAALGTRHIEIPHKSYHPGFGMEIEWEPQRSQLSGNDLAERQEARAAHLRGEIAKREQEIERLIAR